jgi:lysophospholipid acyltransferase (LPLAT)-like uncharacterized protein
MLLLGCGFSAAWRLGSWDRFYLPKPFSRLTVRCELVRADPELDQLEKEEAARRLGARLREMSPDSS